MVVVRLVIVQLMFRVVRVVVNAGVMVVIEEVKRPVHDLQYAVAHNSHRISDHTDQHLFFHGTKIIIRWHSATGSCAGRSGRVMIAPRFPMAGTRQHATQGGEMLSGCWRGICIFDVAIGNLLPGGIICIRMKNILITGVAGMIGSHLLDEVLKRNYNVIGIDNLSFGKLDNIRHNLQHPNFKFYRVDVSDFETLKILGKDIDTIVHLAAYKKISEKEQAMPTFEINGKGTEHIFEVAKMWGCKVVFASTSDVYGMSPDLPLREDGDLLIGPSMIRRWNYAVSKLYGEQMAFAYYHDFGIPIVVIRYFGGFSARSSFAWSGGHIPIFIKAILNDEEITVHGDGSQTRSMGYVDDLVNGTVLAMESEKAVGEIINIGNDEELSVLDSAKLIHEIANTGKPLKVNYVPMNQIFGQYKDILRRIPDLTKAKNLLGYEPRVRLHDAITLTINLVKGKDA